MFFFSFEKKIKQTKPSIVAIGFSPNPNQVSIIGSGFSITNNGRILSCNHLFNKLEPQQIANLKAMVMTEQGIDKYRWLPLSIINRDTDNDLAILQVSDYQKTLLRPLKLGNSDEIDVGNDVYFIGFPYAAQLINDGFGVTLIVNRGVISNIKNPITDLTMRNWIIIDAISNPGNSGCPLLNKKNNKVIGVMSISFRIQSQTNNTLDIREPMHICAAKPINLAQSLLRL